MEYCHMTSAKPISRSCARSLLTAVSLVLAPSVPLFPTTIDPFTWEELVVGADLVGVVACETAGGIVARYRVLDVWKGAPGQGSITIRQGVDYWEPQYPEVFCGERFIVTAYRLEAPSRVL